MGEKETAIPGALKAQQPRSDQEQRIVTDGESGDDTGLADARATTVKGSKSNTSERRAADTGAAGRTVRSSKSNSSD